MTGPHMSWPLTAAATYVLRELDRARPAEVLKLAIKELALGGAWQVQAVSRGTMLIETGRPPGQAVPLPLVHALVQSAPMVQVDGYHGRGLRTLGRHIARLGGARVEPLEQIRFDLERRGLLYTDRTKVLGLIPRKVLRRTPQGEQALQSYWQWQQTLEHSLHLHDPPAASRLLGQAGSLVLLAPAAIAAASYLARQRRWQRSHGRHGSGLEIDGDFDDSAFSELDALGDLTGLGSLDALDGSLDSSFDAGFSEGGGDSGGGGGDSGGGGDGGGGGGGGD